MQKEPAEAVEKPVLEATTPKLKKLVDRLIRPAQKEKVPKPKKVAIQKCQPSQYSVEPKDIPATVPCTNARKPVTTVIPVFSGNHGAGCTWVCIQIASFLFNHGMKCAVSGEIELLRLNTKNAAEGFILNGIDFAVCTDLPKLLTKGYDVVLLDVGPLLTLDEENMPIPYAAPSVTAECMRSAFKIMVADYCLGHHFVVDELMNNTVWKHVAANCTLFLPPRQDAATVLKLQKKYKLPVFRLPISEAFRVTPEVTTLLEEALAPIL
jgi:hypothetical protein